jgi:hypothetical protein
MHLVCGELVGWVWREAIVLCRCGIFTTGQARGNLFLYDLELLVSYFLLFCPPTFSCG